MSELRFESFVCNITSLNFRQGILGISHHSPFVKIFFHSPTSLSSAFGLRLVLESNSPDTSRSRTWSCQCDNFQFFLSQTRAKAKIPPTEERNQQIGGGARGFHITRLGSLCCNSVLVPHTAWNCTLPNSYVPFLSAGLGEKELEIVALTRPSSRA